MRETKKYFLEIFEKQFLSFLFWKIIRDCFSKSHSDWKTKKALNCFEQICPQLYLFFKYLETFRTMVFNWPLLCNDTDLTCLIVLHFISNNRWIIKLKSIKWCYRCFSFFRLIILVSLLVPYLRVANKKLPCIPTTTAKLKIHLKPYQLAHAIDNYCLNSSPCSYKYLHNTQAHMYANTRTHALYLFHTHIWKPTQAKNTPSTSTHRHPPSHSLTFPYLTLINLILIEPDEENWPKVGMTCSKKLQVFRSYFGKKEAELKT